MQILGIRTAPTSIRYAILECNGDKPVFINADSENKIDFPADYRNVEQKLRWLYQELERVLRKYPGIAHMAIKANEYGRGGETASSREAAYLDAAVLMVAGENTIPVSVKLYRSIGTRRNEVKSFAESSVSASTLYWNEQMADAVAAAWSEREK